MTKVSSHTINTYVNNIHSNITLNPTHEQHGSIFSLLFFVNNIRGLFLSNSEIHDISTRYYYNLHLASTNLTLVQGVLYSRSRIYNHLPLNIKILSNDVKHFKSTLRSYIIEHTVYSLDEYYQLTS
jgi:hypothetical protein